MYWRQGGGGEGSCLSRAQVGDDDDDDDDADDDIPPPVSITTLTFIPTRRRTPSPDIALLGADMTRPAHSAPGVYGSAGFSCLAWW